MRARASRSCSRRGRRVRSKHQLGGGVHELVDALDLDAHRLLLARHAALDGAAIGVRLRQRRGQSASAAAAWLARAHHRRARASTSARSSASASSSDGSAASVVVGAERSAITRSSKAWAARATSGSSTEPADPLIVCSVRNKAETVAASPRARAQLRQLLGRGLEVLVGFVEEEGAQRAQLVVVPLAHALMRLDRQVCREQRAHVERARRRRGSRRAGRAARTPAPPHLAVLEHQQRILGLHRARRVDDVEHRQDLPAQLRDAGDGGARRRHRRDPAGGGDLARVRRRRPRACARRRRRRRTSRHRLTPRRARPAGGSP